PVPIVPAHAAPLFLLLHPVSDQGPLDLILVVQQRPAVPFLTRLVYIAPLVPPIEIGGQGHIEFEQGWLRRLDRELFLSQRQFSNGPIPHARVEPSFFIDLFQRPSRYVFWVIQLPAYNLAPTWELFPQECQPFF